MKLTNLADACRASGLKVIEVPGWQTRGKELKGIRAIVCHHTAGAAKGNYPSLAIVRDGRPGISGPLSQLGLGRDGSVYVIAAGRANHAGEGHGFGIPEDEGNSYTIGIEAESTGSVQGDWTPAQIAAYPRLCAALCRAYGLSESQVIGHKEWAPNRKVDPRGFPGDMAGIRATVAVLLRAQVKTDIIKKKIEEIVMAAVDEQLPQGNHYTGKPESLGWAVREMESRIVDRLTAVIVEQTDREIAAINAIPSKTADEILGRKISTPTWRDGKVVQEDTPVASNIARAAEASITRHREETQ